jgi:hypothetical protein
VTSQWGCYHGDHILYISIFYQDKLRLPKHIANIYIYRWTLLNKSFQTGSSLNQRDHMGSSSRDRKPRNEKHLGIWSEYLVIPTINTFFKVIDHCRFHIFIFVMCLWSEHDIRLCPKYQSVQSPQSSSHLQLTYNINHIWYIYIYPYAPCIVYLPTFGSFMG